MQLGIITGSIGSGKTTLVQAVARSLLKSGQAVAGFASEAFLNNDQRLGYILVEFGQSQRLTLCDLVVGDNKTKWGKYYFYNQTLIHGNNLLRGLNAYQGLVMIDEVGRIELQDGGWASGIKCLIKNPPKALILAVRDQFVDEVSAWLACRSDAIWIAEKSSVADVVTWVGQALKTKNHPNNF